MKTPYRKGIPVTASNAAIIAAGAMIAQVYRGVNDTSHKRIVDLASLIVDEIEARSDIPSKGIAVPDDHYAPWANVTAKEE